MYEGDWRGESPAGLLQLLQLVLQALDFALQLAAHAAASLLTGCLLSLAQLHAAGQLHVLGILDPALLGLMRPCRCSVDALQ